MILALNLGSTSFKGRRVRPAREAGASIRVVAGSPGRGGSMAFVLLAMPALIRFIKFMERP